MDTLKINKGKSTKNGVIEKFDDPEIEAECHYAKENGLPFSRSLSSGNGKSFSRSLSSSDNAKRYPDDFTINGVSLERVLPKMLKNEKADRKARSRGVSGCSTKKDGGRFEYGLECMDMSYNDVFDHSDSDDGYDEYNDYVFKYSDSEIRAIVQDYLSNGGNKNEALSTLEKFRITADTSYRMVKDLIQLSLENAADAGVELGCELVEEIIQLKWISVAVLVNILEDITESLAEMCIDSPKVVEATSVLLAKLVEHELLSCSVLRLLSAKAAINLDNNEENARVAKQCYNDALTYAENRTLLQGKCVPTGGHQSLEVLSDQFKRILKEYLLSNDRDVVFSRVQELKVPHFNHEFVYQAGIFALEKMDDIVMVQLTDLLKDMYENGILLDYCLQKGYERLFEALSDLYFDLPAAYQLANRWVHKSSKAGFLSEKIAKMCPTRARGRTLSEGPNGKLFCMEENNEEPACLIIDGKSAAATVIKN